MPPVALFFRAAEAADPDTECDRLLQLATDHPGLVSRHSRWLSPVHEGGPFRLFGRPLSWDEGDSLFVLAQAEGPWQEVQRICQCSECTDDHQILLSYTTLLPLHRHPSLQQRPLIRRFYQSAAAQALLDYSRPSS